MLFLRELTMCKLSKREKEILELQREGVKHDSIIAAHLGINNPHQVAVHRTNVRRKIAKAKRFLSEMKEYDKVLNPKKEYKI